MGGLGLAINVIGLFLFGEVGHGHSHHNHSHGGEDSEGHSHGDSPDTEDKSKKASQEVRIPDYSADDLVLSLPGFRAPDEHHRGVPACPG